MGIAYLKSNPSEVNETPPSWRSLADQRPLSARTGTVKAESLEALPSGHLPHLCEISRASL